MRGIVMSLAAVAALLVGPGAATSLEAQCMGCVSSSGCGESSKRGGCAAQCFGTACACSDDVCQPTISAIPAGGEFPSHVAGFEAANSERGGTQTLLVQYCDGQVEVLVYSADGMQLLNSRLLTAPPASSIPTRLVQTETDRG